jgi:hypothetical protein
LKKIWWKAEKVVPLQPHLTKLPSVMEAERAFERCLVITINSSKRYVFRQRKESRDFQPVWQVSR